jgi:hypothetical protein
MTCRELGVRAELPPLRRPVRLRDPDLDRSLRRDGYLAVPFLGPDALDDLRALWRSIDPGPLMGIWSNVHACDAATNRRVDDAITAAFRQPAADLFLDGILSGGSFLVKGVGEASASTPHQDWNNVDESIGESISIWCPLTDVDGDNGALVVIPGSHRLRPSIRSIDTPSLYLDFTDELEPHLVEVPARAGDAVLYAHNLFHGSKPNRTGTTRPCVVSGVLPAGVGHLHYRALGDQRFEALGIDRRFFMEGIPEMKAGVVPPSAEPGPTVVEPRPTLSLDEVLAGPVRRPFAEEAP